MRRHRARRQLRRGDALLLLNLLTEGQVELGHLPERARARLRTAGMITAATPRP